MIYDRKTRSVALPREKLVFDMDDVIHIQSVSGHLRDEIESMWMAELNLVAIKDGQRRRWNLDVSSSMIRPFGKLPAIIEQETGIPVVRIGSRL